MRVSSTMILLEDDEVKVKVSRIAPDTMQIKFGKYGDIDIALSSRQLKEFAEDLMSETMRVLSDDPYASDKTKGDAFKALRRADE